MRSLFLVLLIFIVSCNSAKENKPNVVLFVVDDLGWTDLSSYGSDLYQTPNVDKLAKNGMLFTDAYSTCTVCSPSRASIMTGKYPARINCTDWISGHKKPFAKLKIPDWTQYMAQEETTLAEVFKKAGYKTIHIGKWHLGKEDKYWPEFQGFDINIGGWSMGAPQKGNGGNGYFPPYLNPRLSDGPEGEYLTERLGDAALKFIEENKQGKTPFFMNFWFYNVHTPLQAKEDKIEKYEKQLKQSTNHQNPVYAAMVEHMDDAVGKVLNKLEENGILENTIVIFTSDNGGLRGNYENNRKKVTSNLPLRSGKGDVYEGGVRVPFIVHWPNNILEGQVDNTPITSADIFPTILGLTGVKINDQSAENIDGIDFAPLLTSGDDIHRDAIYWHYPHYHLEGAKPYSAIRKGDWKLIEIFENKELELYNLKEDIGEKNNLRLRYPEKVVELQNDLNTWRQDVKAQLPKTNPQFMEEYESSWKAGQWRNRPDDEFLEHLRKANQ